MYCTDKSIKSVKSRELRGGVLFTDCYCLRRNGLQHDCRRIECQGLPECTDLPYARCEPARVACGKHCANPHSTHLCSVCPPEFRGKKTSASTNNVNRTLNDTSRSNGFKMNTSGYNEPQNDMSCYKEGSYSSKNYTSGYQEPRNVPSCCKEANYTSVHKELRSDSSGYNRTNNDTSNCKGPKNDTSGYKELMNVPSCCKEENFKSVHKELRSNSSGCNRPNNDTSKCKGSKKNSPGFYVPKNSVCVRQVPQNAICFEIPPHMVANQQMMGKSCPAYALIRDHLLTNTHVNEQ